MRRQRNDEWGKRAATDFQRKEWRRLGSLSAWQWQAYRGIAKHQPPLSKRRRVVLCLCCFCSCSLRVQSLLGQRAPSPRITSRRLKERKVTTQSGFSSFIVHHSKHSRRLSNCTTRLSGLCCNCNARINFSPGRFHLRPVTQRSLTNRQSVIVFIYIGAVFCDVRLASV